MWLYRAGICVENYVFDAQGLCPMPMLTKYLGSLFAPNGESRGKLFEIGCVLKVSLEPLDFPNFTAFLGCNILVTNII